MAHTNSTTNYNLPQWVGSDKPTFLGDLNTAFNDIDVQMKVNADGIVTADDKAENATTLANDAQDDVDALTLRVTTAEGNIANNTTLIGNNTTSINNLTSSIQTINTELTNKQNTITGGASTVTTNNLTANRVLVSDSDGKITNSSISETKLGYLSGVTSDIQTQINNVTNVQSTNATLVSGHSDYRVLHKINNIINFAFEYNGVADSSSPVFTIPTGYRPFRNMRFAIWGINYADMYMDINTNGNVYIGGVASVGASETVYGSIMWLTV